MNWHHFPVLGTACMGTACMGCMGSADGHEDQYEEQMRLCYFLGPPQPHGNSIPSPHGPVKSLSTSLVTCSKYKCPQIFSKDLHRLVP